jgi:hypothetical protein
MSDSDLVRVSEQNGDFAKNWGIPVGAVLYWLTVRATRPRSFLWNGVFAVIVAGTTVWLQNRGWLSALPWSWLK